MHVRCASIFMEHRHESKLETVTDCQKEDHPCKSEKLPCMYGSTSKLVLQLGATCATLDEARGLPRYTYRIPLENPSNSYHLVAAAAASPSFGTGLRKWRPNGGAAC